MKTKTIKGVRTVINDGQMLHINREYYVKQDKEDDRFYVCDIAGIASGEDMEHIGDDFATLQEAIAQCDKDVEHYYV